MSKSPKPDNYVTVICLLKCLPSLFLGYSRYRRLMKRSGRKEQKTQVSKWSGINGFGNLTSISTTFITTPKSNSNEKSATYASLDRNWQNQVCSGSCRELLKEK
ncbi:transmembrane protein, putative [Medicago truncatula]|uniref:Transmembrane protein, putative n=1 Tax=Medicago truncatula TaxID=3880 RepID=A0A072UVS2_MEDTR|nr:transmembrane protein, putative [Medicago truncatula]